MVSSVYNAAKSAVGVVEAAYVAVCVDKLDKLAGTVESHLVTFFISQDVGGCVTANTVALFLIGKSKSCIVRDFSAGIGFSVHKVVALALCIGVHSHNSVLVDDFQCLFYRKLPALTVSVNRILFLVYKLMTVQVRN